MYREHAQRLLEQGRGDAVPRVRIGDYAERLGGIKNVYRALAAGKVEVPVGRDGAYSSQCVSSGPSGCYVYPAGVWERSAKSWLESVDTCKQA